MQLLVESPPVQKASLTDAMGLATCEMCSGSEAGSYLSLIDSCITQLKAQGPSRTCGSEAGSYLRLIDCCITQLKAQGPSRTGGSEAGSYLRLIDSCVTQLKAQGPSRTCNESKRRPAQHIFFSSLLSLQVLEGRSLLYSRYRS